MENIKIKEKHISILICSRNRREQLEKVVCGLRKLMTSCRLQIVVVEETDQPGPINGTDYVPHPIENKGFSFARNLALKQAEGTIIVFLDDDCAITEKWLDKLLLHFEDHSVVGVQGGVTVPPSTNAIGWAESILGFPGGGVRRVLEAEGKAQETKEISTLNCAYQKWVVDEVGGFNERLKAGGEDYLLAKQVCNHGRCLFVPDAMVTHDARGSLGKIWHWFVRRGQAEIDVTKTEKLSETGYGKVLKGSLATKISILIILCLVFPYWIPLLIIAALSIYACVQYSRYYKAWKGSQAPLLTLILVPVVKLTMDAAMDWGRFRRIASFE